MDSLPVGYLQPKPDREAVMRKLRALVDLIERGRVTPDHVQVAWAAGVLLEEGELELATRYERIARRLMPAFERRLT